MAAGAVLAVDTRAINRSRGSSGLPGSAYNTPRNDGEEDREKDGWRRDSMNVRIIIRAKGRPHSAAEGVAVDAAGNVYGAEVGPKAVKKYVKK